MITLLQATDIISTIIYDCLSKSMLSLLFLWLYLFPDTRSYAYGLTDQTLMHLTIHLMKIYSVSYIEAGVFFENSGPLFGNLEVHVTLQFF